MGGLIRSWRRSWIAVAIAVIFSAANPGVQAQGVAGPAAAPSLQVPARSLPTPTTVSPEWRGLIARPLSPTWDIVPKSDQEWRGYIARFGAEGAAEVKSLQLKLDVSVRPTTLGGVKAFIVAPRVVAPRNRGRVLVLLHGGGYVFASGLAGVREALLMAYFGRVRVLAIDYRTPPDAPYPAALDDAEAAWKAVVAQRDHRRVGLFGNSAGGGLALALVERLKAKGSPLPAAIWAGTPWTDLAKHGDSYFTNEGVDNVLVSYDGLLGASARLYAGGHDMSEPGLSPINGDVRGFPPTLLTTGTRDLFLSNTARFHRKLRQAGVEASIDVLEGLSHDDYERLPDAPDTRELYAEITAFFDTHLRR